MPATAVHCRGRKSPHRGKSSFKLLLAVSRSQAARFPTSAATSPQASKAPKGGDDASEFRRDHSARGPGDSRRASPVFRMDWCPTGAGDGSHVPPEQRPQAMDTTSSQEVQRLRAQIKRLEAQLASHALHDGAVEPFCRTYGRTAVSTILSAEDGGLSLVGRTIRVGGWVRNGREAGGGKFAFIELYDGSCFASLQCMVDGESTEMPVSLRELTFTGNALLIEGCLARTPPNTKQKVELKATRIVHYGKSDPTTYSLAGKKISMEFLREKAHLRSRTNTIGVVARIRNALSFATHKFFQAAGFKYVHTPIITASDCEGAGEMFQVSTLLGQVEEEEAKPRMDPEAMKGLEGAIAEQGAVVRQAKDEAAADKQDAALKAKVKAETEKLKQMKAELSEAQDRLRFVGGLPRTADGKIDYTQDFFGRPAYLTVSGQLNGEYTACALSSIYTFGPTFRAENSHTARHLAEFWMIEPELAFADLHDDMLCAEHYVQYCCQYLLENCMPDLEFLRLRVDKTCIDRLRQVAFTPFKRLSYTDAVAVLEEAVKAKKKKFEFPVKWGVDLSSEHERFLTEEVFKQPLIVYDYPKDIKAFYMRLNDDQMTVAAMDVLVPKVGELVGGSQREDRLDVLERRILDAGMDLEPYSGYLDLRRYGSVPHAGFGLGFERLIMFATGIENIRDVIPFPRWPGNAAY